MSRLIRVQNDTYDYLKSMGKKGETFDDVIVRLLFIDEKIINNKSDRKIRYEIFDDNK